jgi:hypothetical protein
MLKSSARMASSGPEMGTVDRCLMASRIDNVAFPLGKRSGIVLVDGIPSVTVGEPENWPKGSIRRRQDDGVARGWDRNKLAALGIPRWGHPQMGACREDASLAGTADDRLVL